MTTKAASGLGGSTAPGDEGGPGDANGLGEASAPRGLGNAGGVVGSEVVTVLMTAPDAGAAGRIVRALLGENLVACGNILPGATSLYRWEGAVQRDEEAVVIMKTLGRLAPRVLERAAALHPYDVPELLVQPVADGAAEYLDWVRRECRITVDGSAEASPGEASS